MKPGYLTTENAQTAGAGAGIIYLAEQALSLPTLGIPHAIVFAAGCLGLALAATMYTKARSAVKSSATGAIQ